MLHKRKLGLIKTDTCLKWPVEEAGQGNWSESQGTGEEKGVGREWGLEERAGQVSS